MLSEAQLELSEGDVLGRRRKVEDILNRGVEYREDESDNWYFGALTIYYQEETGDLVATSPDGDRWVVDTHEELADKNQIEMVEDQLVGYWSSWYDAL